MMPRTERKPTGFFRKKKIDVLVTDLTMPVMDGIELIRKIREENRDIYIIVLSCHDDFEYVKRPCALARMNTY